MQHPTTQDMHFSIARRQRLLRFLRVRELSLIVQTGHAEASKRTNRAANIYSTFYNRWAAACYCCTATQLLDHSFGVNEEEPAVVEANEKQKKKQKREEKISFPLNFQYETKEIHFNWISSYNRASNEQSRVEENEWDERRNRIIFRYIFILGQRQLKQKRVIKRPIVCSSQLWASATSLRQTWRELNAGRN